MPSTTPAIQLYNTRTRRKEPFRPIDPKNVRMYVCGPTVYDRAHIGNARPVVVFDVLFRLMRHVYGPDHVTYVRNFTDVDDKINARAKATGRPIRDITDETIRWYHEDMDALGALRPTAEPRATAHVPGMIAMIETLIAEGHAYAADGHVLFDVGTYPAYGRLSRRSLDDMVAGARVEVAPYKKDPMDFVLWKPSEPGLPGWDSPWGRGRPGWHIECSAMSKALLGETFDLHGGGIDLVFPHHENEVAQSCCANHTERMANVWMHNGFLQVEGEKMAKSLGNFFTVKELLDRGVPGEWVRYVLLKTHYQKPLNWTDADIREAELTLWHWRDLTDGIAPADVVPEPVIEALANDLNTHLALRAVAAMQSEPERLLAGARFLGFLTPDIGKWYLPRKALKGRETTVVYRDGTPEPVVQALRSIVEKWANARSNKNYDKSDTIRNGASELNLGIEIKATRAGSEIKIDRTLNDDEKRTVIRFAEDMS